MTMPTQGSVDQLRAAAMSAQARAVAARELASEIAVRHTAVVGRADSCLARHTTDVWSSKAAIESRTELQRGVAWSLWLVGESLTKTRVALGVRAEQLDASARSYRRQADDTQARLAAQDVAAPVIDMTWLDGIA